MRIAYIHTGLYYDLADELSLQCSYLCELLARHLFHVSVLGYNIDANLEVVSDVQRELQVQKQHLIRLSSECKCISDADYQKHAQRLVQSSDLILCAGDPKRYWTWYKLASEQKKAALHITHKTLKLGTEVLYKDAPKLINLTDTPYFTYSPSYFSLVLRKLTSTIPNIQPALPVKVWGIADRNEYTRILPQLWFPHEAICEPIQNRSSIYQNSAELCTNLSPERMYFEFDLLRRDRIEIEQYIQDSEDFWLCLITKLL